jgi:hypothetical protein
MVFKDAYGYRLYDTVRVKGGVAIPTSPFNFFTIPNGQQTAGLNFAATYIKSDIDTNGEAAGQIPKGQFFDIHSMQIRIIETGAKDTSYGSSGAGTELPTDATPLSAVSASNESKMILEASFYTFHVGNKDYESGKGLHFPSPYGISGFAGGPIQGESDNVDVVAITNNGFGRPYRFPVQRSLDGLRQFKVVGSFAYPITPVANFNIECCLEGILYRDVQ